MKKNFKRLLCLVLVVSLVCSLAVTASAASLSDYTDVDDITYVEAVDVLTGIGILEGTDGAFNGSENMTRAQAAKIIAYLALGAETASSLSATSAPFDDVPLTHWAVGYIAYCASAGIIDGDGTGNFNPDDEVTAYQFGKMLLCTLGYGVNGEYTGASWAVSVAASAGSLGLYKNKEGSLSGNTAITRDEMALYTFNALVNVAQVSYNDTFGEYYVGTSALNAISTTVKGSYQYESYIDDDDNDETAYEYTIGYQTYDLTKTNDESEDAFGRPYYTWQSDGDEISDDYVTDDIDYTITGKATSGDVYSTVGKTIAGYDWTYIVDGEETTSLEAPEKSNDDDTLVARGQYMEVYVLTDGNGDKYVQAIIITDYLAQVTDVDDDDGDIELTLDAYLNDGDATTITIDSDAASNLSSFEEDDWVIVTWSADDDDVAQSIVAATSVEGVPTAYASSAVTVDGTKYNYSSSFSRSIGYGCDDMSTAYSDKNYDDTFVLYLDTYGNLIGFESADESSSSSVTKNYLYVKSASAEAYDGFDDAYVKVKVQFTDGTTDTVYLNVSNEDSDTKAKVTIEGSAMPLLDDDDADDIVAAVKGKIFAYTVNSSGYYTLKSIGTKAEQYSYISVDDVTAVTLGSSTKYATSSTKLVLVDDAKTYSGYANFPDAEYDTPVLAIFTSTSQTRLTYIYVFGDDITTSDDLVYAMYKGTGDSVSDGTYYDFYVAGSVVSYLFDDDEYDSSDFTTYEAGWIEVNSDGYTDFYAASDYTDSSSGYSFINYSDDYFIYAGVVTTKASDSIEVDVDGDGEADYVFALADDYEKTRVKSTSSRSATAASEGDLVWVFTEDDAVDNSMSAEAVAVIAVNPDIAKAVTYFESIGVTISED
ncbi:MAG: S-layer homology domain-containing protein [Oscillospiraceae bacterium]|nr:S-layer homology domain-containing protein [Oscillospiraceae bacterium]